MIHINTRKRNIKNVSFNFQKRLLFQLLFMAAILLVLFIGFTAYGTSIKYNINKIETSMVELDKEINSLSLKIIENTSSQTIEKKAIEELGMEYPSASQYVYIDSDGGKKEK